MSAIGHLEERAAEALEVPANERISFARADRWIGYTRAKQVVVQLDDLFSYPKSIRMPNVLLVARSDNGKSSILEHFIGRHPLLIREDGSPGPHILYMRMPATPTQSSFWSELLWSLRICHGESEPAERKRRQAFDAMQYANVRIVVMDEFNHLTNAGKEAPRLLAAIKNISNALRIPLVASGTQPAIAALNSDPQLRSRFEPAVLDRWTLDREYLRFLASYERFLPLPEPSNLADRILAPKIYAMAGDAIGGTVKVLKEATAFAISHGLPRIDMEVLTKMPFVTASGWEDVAKRA